MENRMAFAILISLNLKLLWGLEYSYYIWSVNLTSTCSFKWFMYFSERDSGLNSRVGAICQYPKHILPQFTLWMTYDGEWNWKIIFVTLVFWLLTVKTIVLLFACLFLLALKTFMTFHYLKQKYYLKIKKSRIVIWKFLYYKDFTFWKQF